MDGSSGTGASLTPGNWYDLTIDWNLDTTVNAGKKAVVRLAGEQVGTISARTTDGTGATIEPWAGLSYLRFRSRSTGTDIDAAGFLIDSVAQDGSKVRDAQRMTSTDLNGALTSDPGWTRFKFDDYVPNNNVTVVNPSGNGTTLSHSGTYGGLVDAANGIGVVVESSTGTVTFSDNAITQVTSDLLGPQSGQTLTLRFVDPADGTTPATVSGVAFRLGSVFALRLGSVADQYVMVRAYDIEGNEMPDWVFTELASGVTSFGFTGLEDLASASVIHEIRFTGTGSDVWLLGSFSGATSQWDFAYSGLTAVPEPSALAGAVVIGMLMRRSRRARNLDGSTVFPFPPIGRSPSPTASSARPPQSRPRDRVSRPWPRRVKQRRDDPPRVVGTMAEHTTATKGAETGAASGMPEIHAHEDTLTYNKQELRRSLYNCSGGKHP